jgi:hypothetical protein
MIVDPIADAVSSLEPRAEAYAAYHVDTDQVWIPTRSGRSSEMMPDAVPE